MKRENKKVLRNILIGALAGIMLIVAGIAVGANCGFSFRGGWNEITKEANAAYSAASKIDTVAIEAESGRVTLRTADEEKTSVDYFCDDRVQVTFVESEGTLTVSQTIRPAFLNTYGGEIVITMPADNTYNVNVSLNAGNVDCSGLNANTVQVELNGGNITMENCTAENASLQADAGEIDLRACTVTKLRTAVDAGNIKGTGITVDNAAFAVDAGEINVECLGVQSEYTLTGKISIGICNFEDQAGTTQKYIHAQADVGNIRIVFAAA